MILVLMVGAFLLFYYAPETVVKYYRKFRAQAKHLPPRTLMTVYPGYLDVRDALPRFAPALDGLRLEVAGPQDPDWQHWSVIAAVAAAGVAGVAYRRSKVDAFAGDAAHGLAAHCIPDLTTGITAFYPFTCDVAWQLHRLVSTIVVMRFVMIHKIVIM